MAQSRFSLALNPWITSCRLGVAPLRGAGLLRCASSRCQRPSVSPLRAAIPDAIRFGRRYRLSWVQRPCSLALGIAGLVSLMLRVKEARLAN